MPEPNYLFGEPLVERKAIQHALPMHLPETEKKPEPVEDVAGQTFIPMEGEQDDVED